MAWVEYEGKPSVLISEWTEDAVRAKIQSGSSAQEGIICLQPKHGRGGWADRTADGGGSVTLEAMVMLHSCHSKPCPCRYESKVHVIDLHTEDEAAYCTSEPQTVNPASLRGSIVPPSPYNSDPHGYFIPFMPDIPLLPPHGTRR